MLFSQLTCWKEKVRVKLTSTSSLSTLQNWWTPVEVRRWRELQFILILFIFCTLMFVCFRCRSGDVSDSGCLWDVSSCFVLSEFCSEKCKNWESSITYSADGHFDFWFLYLLYFSKCLTKIFLIPLKKCFAWNLL